MADVTPDPIMRIAMGFMAAKHLFVASDIGLFEMLASGPATLDDLAVKSRIPRLTLHISADAMVSLGLLEGQGERYCNGETSAAFLSGRPGHDLRPMLRFWDRISYPEWQNSATLSARVTGKRISAASPRRSGGYFLPACNRFRRQWQRHWRRATTSGDIAACSTSREVRVHFL